MSAPFFSAGLDRPGMQGSVLMQLDDGSTATIFDPPAASISFKRGFAPAYPQLVDNSAVLHNRVIGFASGDLRFAGPVQIDRNFAFFLSSGFGPRPTDCTVPSLTPFFATVVKDNCKVTGALVDFIDMSGVYAASFGVNGQFSMSGGGAMLSYNAQCMVLDPFNVSAASTIANPGSSGATGLNISSFQEVRFNNGAGSPTAYDDIAAFSLQLSNQLIVIPAANSNATLAAAGVASGCAGGIITGQLTLVQNAGAAQPIPLSNGTYGLNIIIADPGRTEMLVLALSLGFNEDAQSVAPASINQRSAVYQIFGSANSMAFPFTASYTTYA